MKILSLTNCPLDSYLGSGKAVLRYTAGLREIGHVVDVYEPRHFEILPDMRRARQHRQAFGAWQFLTDKLRKENYDLIEFYGAEFWLAASRVSKMRERPLLVAHTNGFELLDSLRQREYSPNGYKTSFARIVRDRYSRTFFENTDAFVCMSSADLQSAVGMRFYSADSVALVQHGLDEIYLNRPFVTQKENRVAFMGSWIPRKGTTHLVKVMSRVLHEFSDTSLHLYGTGIQSSVIQAQFPEAVRNRIVIHAQLSDQELVDSLSKANVFFFPSQYEGFGLAISEAMACSCAVVTTPTGFGADLVGGKEAMLCGFEDREAMTKSIVQLVTDDRFRESIARTGWAKARSMKWSLAVQKLGIAYETWLSQFHRPGASRFAPLP